MTRLDSILGEYHEAGAVESLVGVDLMVDERTFATRKGALLTVLKAHGFDAECLDPPQIDHVVRRFERATRSLNEDFRIYQYSLKRPHPGFPAQSYGDPVTHHALSHRREYLNGRRGSFFSVETYLVISYEGWKRRSTTPRSRSLWTRFQKTLKATASSKTLSKDLQSDLDDARRRLREAVDSFVVQTADVLRLSVATPEDAFRFLRRLLNYAPEKSEPARLIRPEHLARQLADSTVACYPDHLRLDEQFVQVVSLTLPPPHTYAHLLRDLEGISSPFIIATEWQRIDGASARRLIQSKRRHFHTAQTSVVSYLTSSSATGSKDLLVDDGATATIADLGKCLEELDLGGKVLGQFSLTVVLYGHELEGVRRATAECFKIFAAHDARAIEERYNLLNAWLAILPGNDSFNLRRLWLFDTNCADLSFLFEPHPGDITNSHLQAEHLAVFETESGTPFHFNLHYGDVAHTLLLGSTGSGKSFLLNFLLTSLKKYDPIVFVFDLGRGYEPLTRLFGGGYTTLARGARGLINPFSLAPTPGTLHFLTGFCQVLVESAGYRLTASEEKDVRDQIANLYNLEAPQRRLSTLAQLTTRNVREQLAKWVQGGVYGDWFDNEVDTVSLQTFQTLDFEGLSDYPQVLEPLVFYILHRANSHLADAASAERLKVFILDEAWRFFRHPAIRAYIVEALKTWRKRNAAVILATQSVDDLAQSDLLAVALESCPTKIFLANPGMDVEHYRQLFHLTHTEARRIAALTPKRQFLLKRPDLAKVLTLNVDAKSYWLYTNSPTENALRQEAFARHGLEKGLEILSRRSA